ncbi:delta-60 repeat domain-containing protein [Actinoplanes derwentensis]|uniref:PQQ-like domain-containing protein n=1 Tax=Actinoplanes derwentensis TaxID=113562 RepID=A0A1H1ZCD4_9ACTN|nr:delta-60 repeat domain-containing protein [Actinoplanes derwentensis]GID82359.1 hypothetical protein Ade03nite_12830 [Actinoplanes derwentensis]SDT31217.1 hypothetical protein SAMN04489716_3243 [Actinoplanes derwentensis]
MSYSPWLATLLTGALALPGVPAHAGAVPPTSVAPDRTVGFDGLVYTSVHVGDTVYLGGSFTHAIVDGKSVTRKRLAAVDSRTGRLLPWAPVLDGTVMGLTGTGSSLYVTGKFTKAGGQPRVGLAAIDRKTAAVGALKHTVKGLGQTLAVADGRLYLGGDFSAVDGRTAENLAAFKLSDGSLDTGFAGGTDGKVWALATAGSRLYVGGAFKQINGAAGTARLGALKLADGRLDTGFKPVTPYAAFALTVSGDRVFAGLSGVGGRVQAYRPDGSLAWSSVTDGDVQAITFLNGTVYGGGHFTVACPKPSASATSWCPGKKLKPQPKIAAWDSATGALRDWNPRSNGKWGVLTLKSNPKLGTLTVGGDFTAFGSAERPRFAQFRPCGYGCKRRSG